MFVIFNMICGFLINCMGLKGVFVIFVLKVFLFFVDIFFLIVEILYIYDYEEMMLSLIYLLFRVIVFYNIIFFFR